MFDVRVIPADPCGKNGFLVRNGLLICRTVCTMYDVCHTFAFIAKPQFKLNGAEISLIVQFSTPPTHSHPKSKDYTFQEAEIWHASSNGPSKMKYEFNLFISEPHITK